MKAFHHLKSIRHVAVYVFAVAVTLLVSGCGKQDSETQAPPASAGSAAAPQAPAMPPDPVDMTAFIKAFSSGDQGLKLYAEETVAVVRARAFADAAEQLGKMSRNPKLTAAQRAAVQDLTVKLQGIQGGR